MQIILPSAKIKTPWREPSTTTAAVPRLHGTDLRSFEVQKRLKRRGMGYCWSQCSPASVPPLPLLELGHGLEGVAGEGSERSTEAHHHHGPPARINQHALRGPD